MAEKDAELKGYVAMDDNRVQIAYYQGQYDYITSVKPEVQLNLQVYFSKRWTVALDKMQGEASSTLRLESNIPIPEELVIIPNPEIQTIINDESPVCEARGVGPFAASGGKVASSVPVSITEELAQV